MYFVNTDGRPARPCFLKEGKTMKRVKNMSEGNFLRLFFTFVSVCFIVAAFFMPDRNTMFTGLWNIMS